MTDFMKSRNMEEDRHLWRLGVDGWLLAVLVQYLFNYVLFYLFITFIYLLFLFYYTLFFVRSSRLLGQQANIRTNYINGIELFVMKTKLPICFILYIALCSGGTWALLSLFWIQHIS